MIKKIIFGKKYGFFAAPRFEEMLYKSLQFYNSFEDQELDVDIHIEDFSEEDEALVARNPTVFSRYENSMVTDFGSVRARWKFSPEPHLTVYLSFPQHSAWRQAISRLLSMEYSTRVEIFEQILYELVLIPSTYFFSDRVPIHGAAISLSGGGVILSGTGGTGKTSALLSLRNAGQVSFVSDDMVVLSADGRLFPNLAWPKIYGYNIANTDIKPRLFEHRGLIDRLHFGIRYRMNPAKVRRKILPDELYQAVQKTECGILSFYFLVRENVPAFAIEEIDSSRAAEMCIAVMQTEYGKFHNFLYWEKYNALATRRTLLLDFDGVVANWRLQLKTVFDRITVKLVKIPIDMPHSEYLNQIKMTILNSH